MSITVNTNMSALRIQQNLASATNKMDTAMERMSSGSKINAAKDDAAGYAVSKTLSTTLSIDKVGQDNVAMGGDLLSAADGVLSVISENLTRIADLATQAANGTYSTSDLSAIAAEITARNDEITSLQSTTFNGISLFGAGGDSTTPTAVNIQTGQATTDVENIGTGLQKLELTTIPTLTPASNNASAVLAAATADLAKVTTRSTTIGALQNKMDAVSDALTVQTTNLTSAVSWLLFRCPDADGAAAGKGPGPGAVLSPGRPGSRHRAIDSPYWMAVK